MNEQNSVSIIQQLQSHIQWKPYAALAFWLVLLAGAANGQYLQHKDLAFPQVVAGDSVESVICLTNRGNSDYLGTMRFWTGQNQDWNPQVNGSQVTGSSIELSVGPGETVVLRVTGDIDLTAGAVALQAHDLSLDNSIEGTLVYVINRESYDSVGISPATGLYRSILPFDDFSSVGLALANADSWEAAVVKLSLFDGSGQLQETSVRLLAERSHEARFLSELFTAVVSNGRVEIESTIPLMATAVTLERNEISALPLLPASVVYEFRTENGGQVDLAEVVLWSEGPFVKGYLRFLEVDGEPLTRPENFLVTGTLENEVLRLTQFGAGPEIGGEETVNYLKIEGFSFSGGSWAGSYTRIMNGFPFQHVVDGTFELIRK